MSRSSSLLPYLAFVIVAVAVADRLTPMAAAAPVEPGASAEAITLDDAPAPPAKAELSLSFGVFSEMFGLTDAALQGVIDAALRFGEKADAGEREAIKFTAEQVAMVQRVTGILKGSVNSIEARVYEDAEDALPAMRTHYAKTLDAAGWDRVLRVAEDSMSAEIALRRVEGAIRGVFVIASDRGDDAFVALVDCDLSPQKVRELTDALSTGVLELGLAKQIEKGLAEIREEIQRELK